jgi:hypothetical protein
MPEFEELIERRREERYLEYKESQPWDVLKARIAKTCLGMANIRDGGFMVIGMKASGVDFEPEGVPPDHMATYSEDDLHSFVNRYAMPYVDLRLDVVNHLTGRFVVISVSQFEDVPVICRRDGEGLRRGAIYVRSRRMRETTEIQHETDMRELVDLATERMLQRTLRLVGPLGDLLSRSVGAPAAEERYNEQLRGL